MAIKLKIPSWIRIFVLGLFLEVLTIVSLVLTQNPILFPTIILLGSFLVPITYAIFFYSHKTFESSIKFENIVLAFFYGGILGVLAASVLEPFFIRKLDFLTAFGIGLIEEASKILGVIVVSRRIRGRGVRDGIIIGVAVGMGFASLESMGYAFTEFLRSSGNLTDTLFVTLIRGILSPIGHGTWTGILSGVLYQESKGKRFRLTSRVFNFYFLVSLLHGLWDGLPILFSELPIPGTDYFISAVIVALAGFRTIIHLWKQSGRGLGRSFTDA